MTSPTLEHRAEHLAKIALKKAHARRAAIAGQVWRLARISVMCLAAWYHSVPWLAAFLAVYVAAAVVGRLFKPPPVPPQTDFRIGGHRVRFNLPPGSEKDIDAALKELSELEARQNATADRPSKADASTTKAT